MSGNQPGISGKQQGGMGGNLYFPRDGSGHGHDETAGEHKHMVTPAQVRMSLMSVMSVNCMFAISCHRYHTPLLSRVIWFVFTCVHYYYCILFYNPPSVASHPLFDISCTLYDHICYYSWPWRLKKKLLD